jgi:hypothetical protein
VWIRVAAGFVSIGGGGERAGNARSFFADVCSLHYRGFRR